MPQTSSRPVVYLHIGTPKSGTTYLQGILWHNRRALREEGLQYTGREHGAHLRASFDLQERDVQDGWRDPAITGAWKQAVEEARQWPDRTLISHETFALAEPEHADRALADLDFAEVHLIITMRDLARQIPAAWQEEVKNRNPVTYQTYLSRLRKDPVPDRPRHPFWVFQDVPGILERWARDVPPERVHIVTVPPPGSPPTLVWERFAGVLGIDPGRHDTTRTFGNPSLGMAQAQLLRKFNELLLARPEEDRPSWPDYLRIFKDVYAQQILVELPGDRRITLPRDCHDWVVERAETMISKLRDGGYHIVGDLGDLQPALPADPAPATAPVGDDALLETALQSIEELIRRMEREREQSRRRLERTREEARAEADRLRARIAELEESLRKPAVKLFVRRLSEQYPPVMRARVAYWHAVESGRRVWGRPARHHRSDKRPGDRP